MAMKGIRTTRNLDPSLRRTILDKRLESLYKKAKELSILCDIQIGIIVFGENNVFTWPSLPKARNIVRGYLTYPEGRRLKKLELHETYLHLAVNVREVYINKIEKMVEEMEMENLFNQLIEQEKKFDELGVTEIKGLLEFFAVKRTKLAERMKQLKKNVENEVSSNDNNDGQDNGGYH
ncbi:hypothetical protein RND71_004604 [Anisodus tanguticus]|uniref:MADS-box domain-containing protein n=1 Tax=Anisodus tanguticus TaxID=243964 RepID=A0AAE1VLV0_9SOLA|nr:hypothetical protein RND71_004604 [Anisodus tanguticus]